MELDDGASEATTVVGACESVFDDSINEQYVKQLTIETVKYCKSCKHASNEINPLEAGSHCRSVKHPCYPWWQGSYTRPVGLTCRLCMLAFTFGAFDHEYGSIDHLVNEFKNSQTLLDEFLACVSRLVVLTNQNKMTARVRGKKRSIILKQMAEERRRTVHLVESQGLRVKSQFKGIILEQYIKDHPDENPRENGALIRMLNVPGRGRVECILKRVGDAHEVDVELETSLMSVMSEEIDDGTVALRHGQAAARQKEVANATTELGKQFTAAEMYNKPAPVAQVAADMAAGPAAAGAAKPEGDDSEHDSDEDSEDTLDMPPLISSLLADCQHKQTPFSVVPKLGGLRPAAAVPAKPKAKTSSRSSASSAPASSASVEPAPAFTEAEEPMQKGRGKGKRARILDTVLCNSM